MPAGLVWIDVDQPAADRAVALPADPLAPGSRFKSAAPSSTVALGPLGSVSVSAVSWALLSQVFWVPLLAIDLHDRWVARQRDITPPGQPLPSSPIARGTSLDVNALLGAVRPLPPLARPAGQAGSGSFGQAGRGTATGLGVLMSRAGSGASSLLDRPFTVSLDTPAAPVTGAGRAATVLPQTTPSQGLSMLGRAFTRAQLLGGSVSLADLQQEGPMAPLALVERALGRSSADPLAPLPALWREPMRQALLKLPGAPQQLDTARMVYVPSSSISQPVEVPLALQSDGSVDILEVPANPALLGEIRSWSRQQRPPARGSLTPAVVRLHPLPQAAPLTPLPASAPAASAVTAPQAQLPATSAAAARPIAVPLTSEAPAVSAPAAPIAVPMVSEATAPLAPSAAGSGDPVAPAP